MNNKNIEKNISQEEGYFVYNNKKFYSLSSFYKEVIESSDLKISYSTLRNKASHNPNTIRELLDVLEGKVGIEDTSWKNFK